MMMTFDVKKTVEFDVDDDLAYRVLDFVENDMWVGRPDEDDYDHLLGKDQRALIIAILETALEKYKNT